MPHLAFTLLVRKVSSFGSVGQFYDWGLLNTMRKMVRIVWGIMTLQCRKKILFVVSTGLAPKRVSAISYKSFYFLFPGLRLSKICERKKKMPFLPTKKHVSIWDFLLPILNVSRPWRMHCYLFSLIANDQTLNTCWIYFGSDLLLTFVAASSEERWYQILEPRWIISRRTFLPHCVLYSVHQSCNFISFFSS